MSLNKKDFFVFFVGSNIFVFVKLLKIMKLFAKNAEKNFKSEHRFLQYWGKTFSKQCASTKPKYIWRHAYRKCEKKDLLGHVCFSYVPSKLAYRYQMSMMFDNYRNQNIEILSYVDFDLS